MNGTRFSAASRGGTTTGNNEIREGAYSVSPIRLMANHQWRTLFPYLHPTSRSEVAGQGSSIDFLSVTSYQCDNPNGNDQAVITPIYTPQLYDSYLQVIQGSPFGQSLQNLDITPNNSAAIGVQGKGGKRLPFINQLVPGRGVLATPYGFYDYKTPPSDSIYQMTPPQGKDAPGTIYKAPGQLDKVVNRPLIEVYAGPGLTYSKDDAKGFTPLQIKAGRGLSFSAPDPNDENRVFLEADQTGSSVLGLAAGPAIQVVPPTPPVIASVAVQSSGSVGAVDDGQHAYAIGYTTASDGNGALSAPVIVANVAGSETNLVTVDPIAHPPVSANGAQLCRTKAKDTSTVYYVLHSFSLSDIIAGIAYTDNTADAGLGAPFGGATPSKISVELATDAAGNNISGLLENGGVDSNGLALDPYSPYSDAVIAGPGIATIPPPPPDPPTVAIESGAGLSVGDYLWAITHQYNISGDVIETNPSFAVKGTTTTGNQQALITAPAPPALPGTITLGTGVYRTEVGMPALKQVTIVAGAGALSYTDSLGDGSLGLPAPHQKTEVEVDLATHDSGGGIIDNVSGLIDNAGDDGNGLKVNVDNTTIKINPLNQLVASGGMAPAWSGGGAPTVGAGHTEAIYLDSADIVDTGPFHTTPGDYKLIAPSDGYYTWTALLTFGGDTYVGGAGLLLRLGTFVNDLPAPAGVEHGFTFGYTAPGLIINDLVSTGTVQLNTGNWLGFYCKATIDPTWNDFCIFIATLVKIA